MLKINIVYQNKNMPADVLPAIADPGGAYEVVWSRAVQPGFDAVVYFNEYTFNRKLHEKVCPEALKFLYVYEPVSVDPMQYTKRVWEKFDGILTWNTYLSGSAGPFTFEAGSYFDLPYCSDYGVSLIEEDPDLKSRKREICQICGDKYSLSAEEIYSERRKVARWFHTHAKTNMDVFGRPPMKVPNYRGECADKSETYARYRYALCFENAYHPLWTKGYLTEKILDCMASLTVPVYYGCSNIEELVPADCFIDYRSFSSLQELDDFLQHMSDEEYLGYVERMRAFHRSYNAPEKHSAWRLYETIHKLALQHPEDRSHTYPDDYEALSSLTGKLRLAAMRILLPHHKVVYSMFAIVRAIAGLGRK